MRRRRPGAQGPSDGSRLAGIFCRTGRRNYHTCEDEKNHYLLLHALHILSRQAGIVQLKGKSTWERAEALISIAHPKFQDDLVKKAEEMKIWLNRNR